MAMMEPVAKEVAKKTVKKKVQDKAESTAKSKVSEKAKDTAKEAVSRGTKRTKQFVSKNRPKMWKAPHSYEVRKYHNLLIVMWAVGSLIIATEFLDPKNNSAKVWKQVFAFQMTMFILSWLVLIDVFSEVVAYLSVLIVLAVGLAPNRMKNIVTYISGWSNKTKPDVGTNSGNSQAIQTALAEFNKPLVPRTTDANTGNANTPYSPPQST